jgi:four helix bundle protein
MQVRNFEDLIAWQKASVLAKEIYRVTRQTSLKYDMGLSRQMQRAAVSIMSNIAEGHERGNPGDFHRFLMIAKGSCAELRSQLYLARSIGDLPETEYRQLNSTTVEVGKIIGGLITSVKQKRQK